MHQNFIQFFCEKFLFFLLFGEKFREDFINILISSDSFLNLQSFGNKAFDHFLIKLLRHTF